MNLIALKNKCTRNLMKYNQFYLFTIVLEDLLSVFYFVQWNDFVWWMCFYVNSVVRWIALDSTSKKLNREKTFLIVFWMKKSGQGPQLQHKSQVGHLITLLTAESFVVTHTQKRINFDALWHSVTLILSFDKIVLKFC